MDQILLGAEVPLGRLDRCVPQEQLNLLKFAAGSAALHASPRAYENLGLICL